MNDAQSALLEVNDLCVMLGAARYRAVDRVSFELRAGERACLIGPSGCGKTTLLRAIAGFEPASSGSIRFEGRVLSDERVHVAPHRRGLGMVFQDAALFPHLSVAENVGYGIAHLRGRESQARIAEVLELVGLTGYEERRPNQLSGGQEQRVALARALAPRPKLILLDEPFSSLDGALRAATRDHAARVLASAGATALLVTHDPAEALSFAERLVVLREGRVQQIGSPELVYRAPVNAFVARALGAANLVTAEARGKVAETAFGTVPLEREAEGRVSLCIRPEQLRIQRGPEPENALSFRAEVRDRVFQGSTCAYRVGGEGFELSVLAPGESRHSAGELVSLSLVAPAAVLSE